MATRTRPTVLGLRISPAAYPRATLLLVWLVACAVILFFARQRTFYYDEYDFILTRSLGDPGTWFRPHNEHLVLVPLLVYRFIFEVLGVGTSVYWPYLVPVLICHGLVALALFEIIRREAGFRAALVAATVLLLLGSGGENLLWAFQLGFVLSAAVGMSALALDDRHPRLAFALLCIGAASSAIGLFYVVALAIWRLQHGRPAVALGILPLLYVGWYVIAGAHSAYAAITLGSFVVLPLYLAVGITTSLAGLTGLWSPATALLALLLPRLVRTHTPLVVTALGGLAAEYLILGLGRAGMGNVNQGGSSLYIYIAATFWLLLVPWLLAQPWPASVRRYVPPLAAALALATNIYAFQANQGAWFVLVNYPHWP